MIMPNFLIIESQSAGTTSVYNYLKHHHQIYVSPLKETDFFVRDGQDMNILPHLPPGIPGSPLIRGCFKTCRSTG
jgi:hypothetical protein